MFHLISEEKRGPPLATDRFYSLLQPRRAYGVWPRAMGYETSIRKYHLGRTIGEGTFAKVKLAVDTETNKNVAIKIIDKKMVLQNKLMYQLRLHSLFRGGSRTAPGPGFRRLRNGSPPNSLVDNFMLTDSYPSHSDSTVSQPPASLLPDFHAESRHSPDFVGLGLLLRPRTASTLEPSTIHSRLLQTRELSLGIQEPELPLALQPSELPLGLGLSPSV